MRSIRMNAVWKGFWGCALVLGLVVSGADEARAQANHPGSAGRRGLERGMLYTSVTNLGTQGGSIGAALSRSSSTQSTASRVAL